MSARLALTVLISIFSVQLSAQDCYEFYKKFVPRHENARFAYSLNSLSVSLPFKPGESRCVYGELIQGKDYRITICSDSLYNGVVELVIRNDAGKILYDNSQDDFNVNIEFSCRKTNSVEFVLTAPNRLDVDAETKGCIGLIIEDMVTPRIGF